MPIGFSKACRTCLTLDGTLISIYDSISYDGRGSITDMIKDITKIKPIKSDGLPELMCQTCLNEINRCYSFRVKCLNSDYTLRKLSATEEELDGSQQRQQVAEEEGEKEYKPIIQNILMVHNNSDQIEQEYEPPIKIKTEIDEVDQSFGYFVITSVCSQSDQTIEDDDAAAEAAAIKTFQMPQTYIKQEIDYEFDSYNTSSTRRLTCSDVYTSDQSMYFDNIPLELARPQVKLEPEESFQLESPIINATLKPNIKCPECDREFLYTSRLKKHMRSHNTKPSFVCPTCNKTFKLSAQLRSHISVSHRISNPFKCDVCPRTFPFPSKLKEHLRSHKRILNISTNRSLPRKLFKCDECPRTYYFPSKLKEHLRSHRNKNPSQTVGDGDGDVVEKCKVENSNKAIDDESVVEEKCEKKNIFASLDESALEQSTIWIYENQRSTRRSARIHREELKTPDSEANQTTQQSQENIAETKENKRQSNRSEKLGQVENSVQEHDRTSSEDKHCSEESPRIYNCPHCTKVFKYLSRLNEHVVCHSESRPFDCSNCGKFFKSPCQLQRHLKTSHNVPSFRTRRKTFGRRRTFKNKINKNYIRNKIDAGINLSEEPIIKKQKVDNEDELNGSAENIKNIKEDKEKTVEIEKSQPGSPIKTPKQPKRKATPQKLETLESSDSHNISIEKEDTTLDDDRTFHCELCDETFHVSARFYKHMRSSHGIERPFVCQLCGKGFKSVGNLKSHIMITHEKLKPYECNDCQRTFSCKSNLKKHLTSRVWTHSCVKDANTRRGDVKQKITHKKDLHYKDENAHANEGDQEKPAVEPVNESSFTTEDSTASKTDKIDDGDCEDQQTSVLESVEVCVETKTENLTQLDVIDVPAAAAKEESVETNEAKPTNLDTQKAEAQPTNPLECPQCHKVFIYHSYLKKHLHSHSTDRPFKCTICDKSFKYKVSLRSHNVAEHTKNKPFKCDMCPQEFVNEYNYRIHRNAHIKANKRKTNARRRRRRAIEIATKAKIGFAEKIDDEKLDGGSEKTEKVEVSGEVKRAENSNEYLEEHNSAVSDTLDSSTLSKVDQNQEQAEKSSYPCPHCDKVYLFSSYLKKHMRSHNTERPHACLTCSKTFKDYWRLRSHMMIKHASILKKHNHKKRKRNHLKGKPVEHNVVGKINSERRTKLDEDEGAKSTVQQSTEDNGKVEGIAKIHCTQCDRVFQFASQLETHMRSHTGERPYACPSCNKTFKQNGHLRNHIVLSHKDVSPFQCALCLRRFDNIYHLRAHEKSHRKKMKNSKPKRNNDFAKAEEASPADTVQKAQDIIQDQIIQDQIIQDQIIHDFEKLELHPLFGTMSANQNEQSSCLTCAECKQTFESQTELDEHMTTHSGIARPFNCSTCFKTFKQEAHLKNHIKMSHIKTRNYKCNECNRMFLTFYILSKHMRSHKNKKKSSKSKRGHKKKAKNNIKQKNYSEPMDTKANIPAEKETEQTVLNEDGPTNSIFMPTEQLQTNCALCSALVESTQLSEHMKECLQSSKSISLEMKSELFEQPQREEAHPLFESLSNQVDDKTETGVAKQCTECNIEFCNYSTFADHMLTHKIERPFICVTCGKDFKKNAHLRSHIMIVHKRILPFKCVDCPRVFSSKYNLQLHTKTHHMGHRGGNYKKNTAAKRRAIVKKSYYKDPSYHAKPVASENLKLTSSTRISQKIDEQKEKINLDYSSESDQNRSVSIDATNENKVRCAVCFISVQSNSLSKHMQEFHLNLPDSVTSLPIKKEHPDESEPVKQHPQSAVSKSQSSQMGVAPFDLPRRPQLQCPTCDKEFPHLSRLNEHMRAHSDERPFICLVCGNTYKRHGHLTTHIATCHKRDRPYTCKQCPRTFSNSLNLSIHSQTHMRNDISLAQSDTHLELLNDDVASEEHLSSSFDTSIGAQFMTEETHQCTFCPAVLKSTTQLMEHMKAHTSDQPFICSLCGKAFTNNDDLASHRLLKHNTSKPYQCDQCERDFTTSIGLKKHHLWIHNAAYKQMRHKLQIKNQNRKRTNEDQPKHSSNQLQCYICKKNFTNHAILKEHMKNHNCARPHICTICGHAFAKKYNLKVHIMAHKKIKPFKCQYCPQSYCTNYGRNHHMRTHTQGRNTIPIEQANTESLTQ